MRIENSYSLKSHNSLRLESTAEYYCEITNQEEAQEAIEFANNKDSSSGKFDISLLRAIR